jgi:DNA-binding NarL/FixJ family response regulator
MVVLSPDPQPVEGTVRDDEQANDRPIRVVIADDEPAVADYLRLALSLEDGGFEVVGVVGDAGSAVDVVTELEPDVLLLDLQMPGGGVSAAQLLASLSPATKVLVFTADAEGSELLQLLRSGIAGYLTKSASSAEIVAAVRSVAGGNQSFVPEIAGKAIGELTNRLHAERGEQLRAEQAQQRIDRAIRTQAVTTLCQPVVDLVTGATCGVEAVAHLPGGGRVLEGWRAEARAVDRLLDLEVALARAALARLGTLAEHPGWASACRPAPSSRARSTASSPAPTSRASSSSSPRVPSRRTTGSSTSRSTAGGARGSASRSTTPAAATPASPTS